MTALEIISATVGIIGGGGGILAWVRLRNEMHKAQAERQAAKEAAERADDVDRLSAKTELRQAADGMAKSIWERLGKDLEQAGVRLDSARDTVERQQKEIQELLKRLSVASQALIEAERKLAVALSENQRKEDVIMKLQSQVAALEATVTELRKQLAECTGAQGTSSD